MLYKVTISGGIRTEVALRKSKFPLKLLQAAAKTGSNSCAYDMKENHEDK